MGIDRREPLVDQTDGHGGDALRQPPSIRARGLRGGTDATHTGEALGQVDRAVQAASQGAG